MSAHLDTEVLVVGSGAGGATTAAADVAGPGVEREADRLDRDAEAQELGHRPEAALDPRLDAGPQVRVTRGDQGRDDVALEGEHDGRQ